MASAFRINLTGDIRLQRALTRLDRRAEKNAIKRAVRREATKVRRVLKAHTPVGSTGNLRRSITKREKVYGSVFVVVLGPDYGIAPHAHLIEEGTKPRYRHSTTSEEGQAGYTGVMPAQHFQRRAWGRMVDRVRSHMVDNIGDEVMREVAKSG